MKIALLLGLNVLVVGAGILTYDVIRSDGAAPPEQADTARLDDVLDRLDGLERRLEGLDRNGSERKLSTRLLQLEGRLGAMEATRSIGTATTAAASDEVGDTAAAVATALADTPVDPDAPLAETEIERVKKAMAEVEAQRDQERSARMAEGLVERLGLSLTEEQMKRLGTELNDFRERARDTFRNARGSGMTREDVMATFETLRGELTTELEDFLPMSDAQAISDEIGNGPRGMMGGGPPGGGRGGR